MENQLYETINNTIQKRLVDTNTIQLGNITKVDGGLCDVELSARIEMGGEYKTIVIPGVPLLCYETEDFHLNIPVISTPCPCVVFFSQYSVSPRLSSSSAYDASTARRHDLSNAMALPMMPKVNSEARDQENVELKVKGSDAKFRMSKAGRFEMTNGTEELLSLVSDIANTLARTKAVVSSGSSAGTWDIDTQGEFSAIKSKVESLIL